MLIQKYDKKTYRCKYKGKKYSDHYDSGERLFKIIFIIQLQLRHHIILDSGVQPND